MGRFDFFMGRMAFCHGSFRFAHGAFLNWTWGLHGSSNASERIRKVSWEGRASSRPLVGVLSWRMEFGTRVARQRGTVPKRKDEETSGACPHLHSLTTKPKNSVFGRKL